MPHSLVWHVVPNVVSKYGPCEVRAKQSIFRRPWSTQVESAKANLKRRRRMPPPWFEISFERERVLNDLLCAAKSHQELYAAIQQNLHDLTMMNAANSMKSLAHLDSKMAASASRQVSSPMSSFTTPISQPSACPRSTHAEDVEVALAKHLGALLAERRPVSPSVLADLAMALAKLGQRKPLGALAMPIYRRALVETPSLRGRDVATLLLAAASLDLGMEHANVVVALCPVAIARLSAADLDARDLSSILRAFSKVDVDSDHVLAVVRAAVAQVHARLEQFCPSELSVAMWAVARLLLRDEAASLFPPAFASLASAAFNTSPPRQIAIADDSAAEHLYADGGTGEQAGKPDFVDVSLAMCSVARLEMCVHDVQRKHLEVLLQCAVHELLSGTTVLKPHSLVITAWACAKADVKGSANILIRQVADIAADALALGGWSLEHLLSIAWVLVIRGSYSEKDAHYILKVYDLAVRNARCLPARQFLIDHIHMLVMIDAALRHDFGLKEVTSSHRTRGIAVGPLLGEASTVHGVVGPREQSVLGDHVIQSEMQHAVVEVLKKMSIEYDLRVEVDVRGISVDALLFPSVPM